MQNHAAEVVMEPMEVSWVQEPFGHKYKTTTRLHDNSREEILAATEKIFGSMTN